MTGGASPSDRIGAFRALGFFPADHAAAESGKVYANGAYWNLLRFPSFPAILEGAALVAVVEQPSNAADSDHTFTMTLVDEDGISQPMHIEGRFRAAQGPDIKEGEPGVVPLVVALNGIQFEQAGDFSFVLHVDREEIARYPFHVCPTP
jgi:uncharacterized protein DUF6941